MNKNFIKFNVILFVVFLSSTLNITTSFASDTNNNISSTGGLMFGSKDAPYWFQLAGAIKFDQRAFMGNAISRGSEFYNGANFRSFEIDFNGGLGKDLSYTLVTNYAPKDGKVNVDDAYLTYNIQEGLNLSVGQVLPGFSLESASSGKWGAFLEKTMPTTALGAQLGLGINLNKWTKDYSLTVAAAQPKQDNVTKNSAGTQIKEHDRFQTSARIAYRPIYEGNKILQIGASGYFQDHNNAAALFSAKPEATARNITAVLDTGYINNVSNHSAADVEIAAQNGPLYGELEYQRLFVKRNEGNDRLHFHGYHAQVSYVLTGEAKTFKEFNGVFGQVKPASPKGAWEIAARYSFLNLNNKDIHGGRGNNAAVSLNYYVNNNIKITGEYIRSIQHASSTPSVTLANAEKRKLNILGLRLQAVF